MQEKNQETEKVENKQKREQFRIL